MAASNLPGCGGFGWAWMDRGLAWIGWLICAAGSARVGGRIAPESSLPMVISKRTKTMMRGRICILPIVEIEPRAELRV